MASLNDLARVTSSGMSKAAAPQASAGQPTTLVIILRAFFQRDHGDGVGLGPHVRGADGG